MADTSGLDGTFNSFIVVDFSDACPTHIYALIHMST